MKLVEIGSPRRPPAVDGESSRSPKSQEVARWKEIFAQACTREGCLTDDAKKLAAEGKAVVWIDGGLHASEVLGAQQINGIALHLSDPGPTPETRRILDSVRDPFRAGESRRPGTCDSSYMTERSRPSAPTFLRACTKDIGHDNNRVSHVDAARNINMNRQLYQRVVSADHVQPPPDGSVGTVLSCRRFAIRQVTGSIPW